MRVSSALLLPALFYFALIAFTPAAHAEEDGFGAVEISDPTPGSYSAPRYTQPTYTRSSSQPVVGRRAAAKYMATRGPNQQIEVVGEGSAPAAPRSSGGGLGSSDAHYLAIHLGGFVSDTAYKWGMKGTEKDVGGLNIGVTYRLGEWINSADFAMRVDYLRYTAAHQNASKLSFLPVILFPDASSKFPLYFGVGLGLGVFVNQLDAESPLSLDYQLLLGARFFDLFNNAGLFIEAGLKNHLHLFSDGQFNGTFVAAGGVFTF